MVWRSSSSKHARPSGRGALKAAYADLQGELAAMRRHRYDDTLENARLTALVDALGVQLSRLHGELGVARGELADARAAAAAPDPAVAALAAETAELRSALAAQHEVLLELTARLGALLDREPAATAVVAPTPEPVAPVALAPVEPAEPDHHDAHDEHVVHLTDSGPLGSRPPSFVDDRLDDYALLRLRMIRQTLTADEAAAMAPVPTSSAP